MTTIALIFVATVLFFIGLISPHAAGKIQRKTDKEAGLLKRCANWFWDPVTWWAKNSIEFSRKAIDKAAGWGSKTRKKM
jgi:hypothetical protein